MSTDPVTRGPDPFVRAERGRLLLERGRCDLAEKELRLALAGEPNFARAHAWLALALSGLARHSDAISEAQAAVHLDPQDAYGFYVLAGVLGVASQLPEALRAIYECLRLEPNDADYLARLAHLQHQSRQWPAALATAEQCLAIDPAHPTGATVRALSLVALGQSGVADTALHHALVQHADSSMVHAGRGFQLLHLGNHESALANLLEALRLDPDRAGVREALLACLKRKYRWLRILQAPAKVVQAALPVVRRVVQPILGTLVFQVATFTCLTIVSLLAVPADAVATFAITRDPIGRLALQLREKVAATLVIGAVVTVIGLLAAYMLTGEAWYRLAAVAWIALLIPCSRFAVCPAGRPRQELIMFVVGVGMLFGVTMAISWHQALTVPFELAWVAVTICAAYVSTMISLPSRARPAR